jgi:hypothetical protein
MKKNYLVITAIALTSFGAFGQGYVNLSFATHRTWDEFTVPGVGVNAATMDFAVYWAAVGTTDPLASVGAQFGQAAGTPMQQVATNGVGSMSGAYRDINTLLTGAGFTLGSLNGTAQIGTIGASGNSLFGQTQFTGTTGGDIYQMIVVAWDAASGPGALVNGTYSAIGWSNPFDYLTGSSAIDPNGQIVLSNPGLMNQFGVVGFVPELGTLAVPEPGTLALATIGGATVLLFRRKK